jgi:hypothetical protein
MAMKTAEGVEKRLYTLKEAAGSLGICTKSARGLVKRGLLKPIKRAFHKFLFTPAELDRFVKSCEAD